MILRVEKILLLFILDLDALLQRGFTFLGVALDSIKFEGRITHAETQTSFNLSIIFVFSVNFVRNPREL